MPTSPLSLFHGRTPKENQSNNLKSNCFPGCFGFSGKKKPLEATIQTSSKNKTRLLLSWPMFRLRVRKSRTQTVPIDNTENAEADHSKSHTPKVIKKKSDGKLSSKPQSPTNHKPSRQNSKADQQLPSSNQAAGEKPEETRLKEPDPKIIFGYRKLLDPGATGSSQPGSPNVKPKIDTNTKLSDTVSLPVLEGNQRVRNARFHTRINVKELQRKNNEVVEKFDPVMGLCIIMMTLIIMLLWGRLCAILCTSAWFCFCRRCRAASYSNGRTVKSTADLNSEEYKKKVVLEGLLERNHRITV